MTKEQILDTIKLLYWIEKGEHIDTHRKFPAEHIDLKARASKRLEGV